MGTRRIDTPVQPETVPAVTKTRPTIQPPVSDGNLQQNKPVKIPEPLQQRSELGKGIALFVPGCLIFLAGVMYATSSKTAGNFDAFYQQMILGNVMVSLGIVVLYHALGIFWMAVINFIHSRRHNL